MKKLPWILVILLAVACVDAWFRPHEPPPAIRTETKVNTIVKVETLLISPPMAPLLVFRLTDTMRIGDTVVYREQAYYEDSLYRAWVSGYRPTCGNWIDDYTGQPENCPECGQKLSGWIDGRKHPPELHKTK